jgi:hypothetical protein
VKDREAPPAFHVKQHPELRHVFAHVAMATEYLVEATTALSAGQVRSARAKAAAAQYSLDEVRSLVYFGDDYERFVAGQWREFPPEGGDRGWRTSRRRTSRRSPATSRGAVARASDRRRPRQARRRA